MDSNGATAGSGQLDTSAPGPHIYTVTVRSQDGQSRTSSISYTVAAAPSITVTAPTDGATYALGQAVDAAYACEAGTGGPGIASCNAPASSGAPIDTSSTGTHAFTITATSSDGQVTTKSIRYRVVRPGNRFTITRLRQLRDGRLEFDVHVPGPGVLNVLETAWRNQLAHAARVLNPAKGRFAFARVHRVFGHPGTFSVVVKPNLRGRTALGRHREHVTTRLWVAYTPTGGRPRTIGFYGLG
ncbi:MAG: hypothetical protein ACRDNJ_08345 [Solirubrobacteraceae bacterium]